MSNEQAHALTGAYAFAYLRALYVVMCVLARATAEPFVLTYFSIKQYGAYLVIEFEAIRARKGERSLVAGAILIPVSLLISAVLIPAAFSSIYGANTSGWNAAVVTVFQILLPVLSVIAIAYSYYKEME